MIVSQLTGGLGNQLFQYAVGYAAAARARQPFRLDLRHYDVIHADLPPRPFALDRLTITAPTLSPLERVRVRLALASRSGRRAVRAFGRLPYPRLHVVEDRAEGYDPRLEHPSPGTYLIGCWQSEAFFADRRAELLDEFRFRKAPDTRNAALIERIRSRTAVSVHFRRTDYLAAGTLTRPCSLDYYARALAAMREHVPDAAYYVFTDDPEWVAANATLPPDSTIVTHNTGVDDAEDMRLMAQCDHFIIANSSFSWWGAWLARRDDKRVIAPATWYERPHGSEKDLVPASWMRL